MKPLILLDMDGRPVSISHDLEPTKVSRTPRRFDMSIVRMNRYYTSSSKKSWFEDVDFGGLFVVAGLAAVGFGAYQAYQGGSNAILWIAMGLIVNQAGMCIADANARVKKILDEANEDERRASNQRQLEDLYTHIDTLEEKRKNEGEKDLAALWRDLSDLKDDFYELKEKSSTKR